MTAVLPGFIVEDSAVIKSICFALVIGILIDAFIVRKTLIPAIMRLLGEKAWWLPKWLDRIVPRVDIEGTSREKGLPNQANSVKDEDEPPGKAAQRRVRRTTIRPSEEEGAPWFHSRRPFLLHFSSSFSFGSSSS